MTEISQSSLSIYIYISLLCRRCFNELDILRLDVKSSNAKLIECSKANVLRLKNFFNGLFYLLIGFHAIFLYLYSELLSFFSENFLVQDSISGSFIRFHAYVIITIFDIHEFQLDITTLRSSTGSTWFVTITFYSVKWWVIWWDIRLTVWYRNFRNA